MTNLDVLKSAFPALDADVATRTNVERATRQILLESARRRRFRRTLLLASGTGVLVLGVSLVGPKAYAVYRLKQIAGSVTDVTSATIESYRIAENGRELIRKTIYSQGKWRMERGDQVQVYSAGKLQIYSPETKRVTIMKRPDGPFGYNPSGFSVSSMLSDMARWKWRQAVTTGTGTLNGRKVDLVTITGDSNRERTVVYADPITHFPLEYRSEASSATGWHLRGISKPTFNTKIDPEVFVLEVPEGTKFVDQEAEIAKWRASIETPIAMLSFGKHEIQVRQVTVNTRGHVFIIYTNGETKADREAYGRLVRERRSDQAMAAFVSKLRPDWTAQAPSLVPLETSLDSFQPYVGGPHQSDIVLDDGQILQGAWLIPTRDSSWKPGLLKLEASAYVGREQIKRTLEVPLTERPDVPVPDWMALISMGPKTEKDLLRSERRVQTEGFKKEGNWSAVVKNLRKDLEDIFEEEAKGQTYAKGTNYYELYNALRRTGSREEALEFLQLAAKEPLYPNQYPADAIAAALRREGL